MGRELVGRLLAFGEAGAEGEQGDLAALADHASLADLERNADLGHLDAAALAARFGGPPVAEYGRERWEARGGRLDEADLLAIAREQVRREDLAARSADPVLVCDTSPLTTFGYAHWSHGRADPALAELAERRYTLSVLCGDEIPFDQDGTRRDAGFRARQQAWYRDRLAARGDRHVEVHGSVAARVEEVVRALAAC